MHQDPDLPLVRDLTSGDLETRRRALALLYERHRKRVFNVAARVLGDWSEAQDVTQEVFLLLARRIRSFRGDSTLASWIYRIAVNRAIDARRHDSRRPAWRGGAGALGEEGSHPTPRPDPVLPHEALDRREDARRVQAALGSLSPNFRAILVLRYLEGLSYDDLAQVMGCTMGTVKSRLNRAHAALERAMREGEASLPAEEGPEP